MSEIQGAVVARDRRPLSRRIDMRVDDAMYERIEEQAARHGLGVSAYIRLAVTQRLEQDEASEYTGLPPADNDQSPAP